MQSFRLHKRSIICVILALVMSLLVGYYLTLQLEREAIRSAVKTKIFEGLDRSELVFIPRASENDVSFEWKENAEFSLNGHFYDIVERISIEGAEGYWCWLDNDESDVEDKINSLCALNVKNNPATPVREFSFQNLIDSLYFETIDAYLSQNNSTKNVSVCALIYPLLDSDTPPSSPPPEYS